MVNYLKKISNKQKTACVLINRTLLSDGYNYYLSPMVGSTFGKLVFSDYHKQSGTILSEKKAIEEAKLILTKI